MFAFKSSTGEFLGAQQFTEYTDIREWLTADGELYAGVQNCRWKRKRDPLGWLGGATPSSSWKWAR